MSSWVIKMQCLAENNLVEVSARKRILSSLVLFKKATKTFTVSTVSCAVASKNIATAVTVIGILRVAMLTDLRWLNTNADTMNNVTYVPNFRQFPLVSTEHCAESS